MHTSTTPVNHHPRKPRTSYLLLDKSKFEDQVHFITLLSNADTDLHATVLREIAKRCSESDARILRRIADALSADRDHLLVQLRKLARNLPIVVLPEEMEG